MGSVSPGGFDVVVHLAESVINRGLALIPNGTTFPIRQRNNVTLTALAVPLPLGGGTRDVSILYDAFLEADRPQVTLNQSDKTVSIHCNLTPASQLTFLRTVNAADAALLTGVIPQIGLGGSIELDGCTISVENVSGIFGTMPAAGSAAVAHAGGVSATIALVVPTADAMNNVTLASSAVTNTKFITVMTSDIQSALATAFGAVFGNAIGDLPLTNPVLLNAGTMPVQMVKRIDAAISPTGSPAAISLGVLTAVTPPSPGGTIPAPPADLGPEIGAVLGVANYWTLQLVCSALTGRHPGMKFTIDQSVPSASFSGGVTVPGGDQPITIRKLDITAGSGGLAIVGHATASADCWDASIDFDFDFTFTCNPATGAIMAMVPNEPNVNVSTDTSLFCEIVGAVLGTIVGILVGALVGAVIGGSIAGIPGVIAGGIIGGVVGGVSGFFAAGALIDPLDNTGVSLEEIDVLAGLTLPLPVGGAGFLAQSCSFDDFVAAGNLVFFDLAERHRSGSVQFAPGSGFDLDAGVVRASLDGVSDDPADLFWSGSQLQVLPGAHTGPQFDSRSDAFDTLSLTDLEGFTYGTTAVPLGAFNLRSRLGATVTFAARTDEGRFAKCRARRDLSGRCNLDYIVYERPPVCLSTVITIDTLSQRVTDKGTDTCTEVHDVVPFNPFLDIRPLAPSAVATAILQRPAPQLAAAQNVVHFPDLQDLFDRGG
ncbi:MAG TPA: hypothetical protein VG323_10600, partial [Thermoanaerobaculia bacterium]|nr:hypothetical protein [Thermoanaerobaculia bacterium]